jgi:hypothetical protein
MLKMKELILYIFFASMATGLRDNSSKHSNATVLISLNFVLVLLNLLILFLKENKLLNEIKLDAVIILIFVVTTVTLSLLFQRIFFPRRILARAIRMYKKSDLINSLSPLIAFVCTISNIIFFAITFVGNIHLFLKIIIVLMPIFWFSVLKLLILLVNKKNQ